MKVLAGLGVVMGIVGVLALVASIVSMRAAGDAQKPLTVRIERPLRGDLLELVSAPGEVEPREKVQISARIAARVTALPHEEGDEVRGEEEGDGSEAGGGSVLVRLDDSDLRAALESAEARRAAQAAQIEVARARLDAERARLEGLRASLAEAQLDLERQRALLASKDVAQSVVDAQQRAVDELSAQLDASLLSIKGDELNIEVMGHNLTAADADIRRAREDLEYTTIRSPIDGIITRINVKQGELVMTGTMNNPGTVLMEVADLSSMLFVAQIDEADIGQVEVNQQAQVVLQAYPDDVFDGVVESIALRHDLASNGSKYFKVKIALETAGRRIYSGLSGDVQIAVKRYEQVLKVPSQAVLGREVDNLPLEVREDNPNVDPAKTYAAVVYRAKEGKAIATPVTIGPSDTRDTAILDGLTEEDRVIVGPYKVLENLQHDQLIEDEREAARERAGEDGEDKEDAKPTTDENESADEGVDAAAS